MVKRFATLCLLGLACGEPDGPSRPTNPVITVQQLSVLDSVFASRMLQTQNFLALMFHPARDQSGGTQVLSDSVLGRTYEWDTVALRYTPGPRVGAPGGGVRYLLYALDRFPMPLVELGMTDLLEASPAGSLQVIVKGQNGTPTHGNYRVGGQFGTHGFTLSAVGYVAEAGKRMDIAVAIVADDASSQFDLTCAVPSRGIRVHVMERFDQHPTVSVYAVDYLLQHDGESLRMMGPVTVTEIGPGVFSTTAEIDFRVNGHVFARIRGTDATIALRGPDGELLPNDLLVAANRLFRSPAQVHAALTALLQPAANILSGS